MEGITKMAMAQFDSVDDYIASFPPSIQTLLKKMRQTVKKAAPKAEEKISYGIPTLFLNGNLVHFGAFKKHIGFYPGSLAIKIFQKELSTYSGAKGSVQFPYDEVLPLRLVSEIVKFRVEQNSNKKKKKSRT